MWDTRFVFDRWFAVTVVVVTALALSACEEGPGTKANGGQNPGSEGRTAKFRSVEEHLSHRRVRSAIASSGHEIHRGDSPPVIGGLLGPRRGLQPAATVFDSAEYRVVGSVTKTSEGFSALRDQPVRSMVCFHDQGADGSISVRESALGINVSDTGSIEGSGDKFTVLVQSHQDLSAQLRALSSDAPDLGVCVADLSVIMSGRCPGCSSVGGSLGDLVDLRTLTTVTSFECPKMYGLLVEHGQSPSEARQAIESIASNWYETSSTAFYQAECSQ